MSSKIFRQASLARLNSPEQLDTAITVTQPRGWLAAIMIGIILLLIFIWSLIGSIYTRVNGQGILIRSGGMIRVVSTTSGQVQEMVAEVGSFVKQGQIVARIHQPELLNQIHNLKADMDDAHRAHNKLVDYHSKNIAATKKNLDVKRLHLNQQLKSLEKRKLFFKDLLKKQDKILKRGLITPSEIDRTYSQLNPIIDEINSINLAFNEMEISFLDMKSQADREILAGDNHLDELMRELRRQESSFRLNSLVHALNTGRVVEVRANNGDVIDVGSTILILENPTQKMEALLYVDPADGKKIKAGMEIDISPSTVRVEEFGSILGLVTHVSKYPASPDVIHQTIPNQAFVEELLALGVPIEVHADLIPDDRTPSGYKWTSSTGPVVTVQVGTMVECSVRVKDRRPITLVLPYLKKILGIR